MKKKLMLLLLATTMLAGCGNTAKTDSVDTKTDAVAITEVDTSTTEAPEDTQENVVSSDENVVYSLNEECVLKDWSIIASNVEITDAVAENEYYGFTPDDGNKYLVIDITVTNNGTAADTFLPSYGLSDDISAKVIFQGTYEYSSTNLLGYGEELHDTSVNPLSSKSGRVSFEIPDTIADSTEELILKIGAGRDFVDIKIR